MFFHQLFNNFSSLIQMVILFLFTFTKYCSLNNFLTNSPLSEIKLGNLTWWFFRIFFSQSRAFTYYTTITSIEVSNRVKLIFSHILYLILLIKMKLSEKYLKLNYLINKNCRGSVLFYKHGLSLKIVYLYIQTQTIQTFNIQQIYNKFKQRSLEGMSYYSPYFNTLDALQRENQSRRSNLDFQISCRNQIKGNDYRSPQLLRKGYFFCQNQLRRSRDGNEKIEKTNQQSRYKIQLERQKSLLNQIKIEQQKKIKLLEQTEIVQAKHAAKLQLKRIYHLEQGGVARTAYLQQFKASRKRPYLMDYH